MADQIFVADLEKRSARQVIQSDLENFFPCPCAPHGTCVVEEQLLPRGRFQMRPMPFSTPGHHRARYVTTVPDDVNTLRIGKNRSQIGYPQHVARILFDDHRCTARTILKPLPSLARNDGSRMCG